MRLIRPLRRASTVFEVLIQFSGCWDTEGNLAPDLGFHSGLADFHVSSDLRDAGLTIHGEFRFYVQTSTAAEAVREAISKAEASESVYPGWLQDADAYSIEVRLESYRFLD